MLERNEMTFASKYKHSPGAPVGVQTTPDLDLQDIANTLGLHRPSAADCWRSPSYRLVSFTYLKPTAKLDLEITQTETFLPFEDLSGIPV
ncbi:hypothetical protein RRG08_007107 [Elysia crispata]|uniref:Uncharacterized protein n=1 Tax=Elysia crispata TaxID=231223 RepID=A0AAE1D136_9GAST|nr:hypothetical protein RRG08_007107 [Elysia crispata]